MKLATYKPWMHFAGQFDHFYKLTIRRNATERQAILFEDLPVLRIEFVTVPVTFADFFCTAIKVLDQRTRRQPARPRSQPHRTAQFLDINKISQLKDHGMRSLQIKLGRIGILKFTNSSGILNTSGLHSQTYAEIGCAGFARI